MTADLSAADLPSDRVWRHRIGQLRHDLVNAVGEVLGFAEILLEEDAALHPAIAEGLASIGAATRQALAEINRVLNPDALRANPGQLAPAGLAIESQLAEVAVTATRLTDYSRAPCHEDLLRIANSATRLRAMQTATFAAVLALPIPAEAGPPPGATQAPFLAPARDSAAPLPVTVSPPGIANATVLVVDDQEPNRALLERRLRRRGHEVVLAEHGRRALELLRARHFDLVLLDIMMPEIGGMEVLRQLKADPRLAHIPVLMLSAFDDFDAVVRCVELGAEDYLPKPFPAPLLHARVDASLANKRMSDQLRKYAGWLFGPTLFTDAVAAPATLVLKRHQRTVLFADIRGFTQWSERHTPEETVALLNGYFETAEPIWAGSSLIKTEYTGDEIMAVFPVPLDAVRVAHALREKLGACLSDFDLGIGIGVHTGPVIEGLVGGSDVKAYRFVGDTVNTAKRICTEAQRAQILVSDTTYAHVAGIFHAGPSMDLLMKGKAAPTKVWQF